MRKLRDIPKMTPQEEAEYTAWLEQLRADEYYILRTSPGEWHGGQDYTQDELEAMPSDLRYSEYGVPATLGESDYLCSDDYFGESDVLEDDYGEDSSP